MRTRVAGFTLLEVMISLAIFSAMVTMVLVLAVWAASLQKTDSAQTAAEDCVQNALDVMARDIRETVPYSVASCRYTDEGREQDVLVCFTARDAADRFVLYHSDGTLRTTSPWQGVVAYAVIGRKLHRFYHCAPGLPYASTPTVAIADAGSKIRVDIAGAVIDFARTGIAGASQQVWVLPGTFASLGVDLGTSPFRVSLAALWYHEKTGEAGATYHEATMGGQVLSRTRN